ncbi:hypothetical protein CIW48_19230 [Methylobacterium sp. P1-11]|uniref:hypothetical protein n=1 Tax=Methylobacterium sp. P1-11 TaxID=2024616 RepID=UPI0011EF029C|nr:hypothetical protein [Methylobacterium sp. P1-11]KAA0122134.1 hypothetical protein CIW48_19230 [Methylobacterium sp. P1-11]
MIDISQTTAPRSDQLNADDLIGGPRTITVTRVSKMKEPDQPIAIYFEGDGGKPYKPGKSMRRVLLRIWGSDGEAYAGRRMTLYRDDAVQFGGMAVGGIRISHMSGITSPVTMPLTVTKAVRRAFTVKPLAEERSTEKPAAPKRTLPDVAREKARAGREVFEAWRDLLKPAQVQALAEIEGELDRLMAETDTRDDGPPLDDDGFPGFAPPAEEAA